MWHFTMESAVSHPRRKNRDAPRVGHPARQVDMGCVRLAASGLDG
jgi:hypothetical protein